MPNIKIPNKNVAKYRVFFYSYDCAEKMHVHVEHDNDTAKLWVEYDAATDATTLSIHDSTFSTKELNSIIKHLQKYGKTINEQWKEHCKNA
jgi:hypothetical protein